MSNSEKPINIGLFKSLLSVWITLAIILGLVLGSLWPATFEELAKLSVHNVNPVTALLVWGLILPTMVQLDYSKLGAGWSLPVWRRGALLTLGMNWLIKPSLMAILAIFSFKVLFANSFPLTDANHIVAGLILLGIAPCTGMVFIWSRMTGGDITFTLSQVALNNIILLFAFVPIASLLLSMSNILIPWATVAVSTLSYVIAPLVLGYFLRQFLELKGSQALQNFSRRANTFTKCGLIFLVVVLFGLQAPVVLESPLLILMVAMPIVIQLYGVFFLSLYLANLARLPARFAAPVALISTSNFFELAVAVALSIFGVDSLAVIATVVGALVEIPVMLSLVSVLKLTSSRFAYQA